MSNEFKLLINGALVGAANSTPVLNPATQEVVGLAPRASVEQLEDAIGAAKAAFPGWAATPLDERRKVLVRIADAIDAEADTLAELLTREQGKPLPDARAEVGGTAYFFRYFAAVELEDRTATTASGRTADISRVPLGVVAAIVPWNFPLNLMAAKVPPALLAGNTVLLKPAPSTPLSTLEIGRIIKDILPPGVLNIIADENDLGERITGHPDIRKVSFTGSTQTGRRVMRSAAETIKRITLELGGNDPAIVLSDADPVAAAEGIFQCAFANNGQVCLAIKRVYVQDSIYDVFCDALASKADAANVGNGLDAGTELGPLQNKAQYERVLDLIEDSKISGKIIAGGAAISGAGYFIRPTIVRDVGDGARIVDEEQFGPILPVVRFGDIDDAIARANRSEYGLGASVWGNNPVKLREVAAQLDAGTVWINGHLDMSPNVPFAGAKQSGLGVELSEQGLHEYTQFKVINSPA
ncbi:aldehyde dehydrogenase (plasmid) [Sphingomonas panacis]|uniref:Aldehyde dehydrogenase n=1 Tax=Sphingomonas panacis TaxID=1560345 RepID=A0A1B3ZIR4_9SPHN|nr:aldehyde dehydrogenase family protein [Sphingomonas panacis]AOH87313.1 aldehyde dehydrogenase [Sphingomonas panacis]